jgi:hypothetical protein
MKLDSERQRELLLEIISNVGMQGKFSELVNHVEEVKALRDAIAAVYIDEWEPYKE